MWGLKLLVLLPGAACFIGFGWGTVRHFRSVGPVPHGMRLIEVVSIAMMAVFAWLVLMRSLSWLWPATPVLCLVSLALFIWTVRTTRDAGFTLAFSGAQPSTVLMSGPFRYVRHPFYTSYLIFWFATCTATLGSLPWIGLLILLVCYATAARQEERIMSRGRLAAEYAGYASQTGMFLPRINKSMLNIRPGDFRI